MNGTGYTYYEDLVCNTSENMPLGPSCPCPASRSKLHTLGASPSGFALLARLVSAAAPLLLLVVPSELLVPLPFPSEVAHLRFVVALLLQRASSFVSLAGFSLFVHALASRPLLFGPVRTLHVKATPVLSRFVLAHHWQ